MKIEVHSETWREVKARAEAEIARLREALEQDKDHESTTRTRAALRAYKDVLTWADAAPSEEVAPEVHFGLGQA